MRAAGLDRAARVGDQIQRELAVIIQRELNDPRLKGVTVSGVKLSRDLKHARVFVTPARVVAAGAAGADAGSADAGAMLAVLRKAAPLLRRRLADQVRLRYLPRLEFSYDATLDEADRMESLLREARGMRTSDEHHGDDPQEDESKSANVAEHEAKNQSRHEPTDDIDPEHGPGDRTRARGDDRGPRRRE